MAATLKDIATLAGVSIPTVNKVLNGYVGYTAETCRRVQAIAAELGFEANIAAPGDACEGKDVSYWCSFFER